MRREDRTRLEAPYPDDGTPKPSAEQALGVDAPNWLKLETAIKRDFVTVAPWGIGWWSPHPGTSRRILIADHLLSCTRSVHSNLLEAALHWLEYLDWSERESDRNANALTIVNRQPVIRMSPPANTLEEVGDRLIALHAAGVARALSGALDCMAGTIIGVTALPLPILKADLGGVRQKMERYLPAGPCRTADEYVHAKFARTLERLIDAAGPHHWLDWLLAYRNMLVHRGRRIEVGQFVPRLPIPYDARQRPIPRVSSVMQLPLDPGRSDVEVLVDAANAPVLTEDASDTLSGLVASTRKLANDVGDTLLQIWEWRKANPNQLPQPQAQWPNGRRSQLLGFGGYRPGTQDYNPGMLVGHPGLLTRIRAAALEDNDRPGWPNFN